MGEREQLSSFNLARLRNKEVKKRSFACFLGVKFYLMHAESSKFCALFVEGFHDVGISSLCCLIRKCLFTEILENLT